MGKRAIVPLGGLVVPLTALACWQWLKAAGVLDYEYLPSPGDVLAALVELARSGELARDLAHTLGVTVVAAATAMTLGAMLGFAIGLIPSVRRYAMASVDFLRTIPAVALLPVAVLTFGPIPSTEVLLAVYAALWPTVLHTAAGVAAVHPRQYDVVRMLHFGPLTTLRKVVIPAVVPAWLVGARMAAVVAMLVAIVAEMIMYPNGLGGGLIESLQALAPARMWAYALVCGIVGVLLNAGLRQAVRLALPGGPGHAGGDQPIPAPAVTALRGLLPLGILLIVWQLMSADTSLSFPPPDEWIQALDRLRSEGLLSAAIVHTLGTYAFGLVLAVVIGATAGMAIGASRLIDRFLTPTIDFIAAVPGAALVPVAVLLLGPSQLSGVAVVALVVSWPVLLNTAAAMRSIPLVRLEMSRTIGLSPVQRCTKVILPSLSGGVMLGVSVASSLAVIITLLVDILGAGEGIGRLLVESQQHFDAAAAWGLLLIVGGFGYLMNLLISRLERRMTAPGEPQSRMSPPVGPRIATPAGATKTA
ncbi:MAG TPA: ABC transporter permease subunit [Mycobacterium sp.]|nr:ABC transporter permease subunit [Mycobacterium sp.]